MPRPTRRRSLSGSTSSTPTSPRLAPPLVFDRSHSTEHVFRLPLGRRKGSIVSDDRPTDQSSHQRITVTLRPPGQMTPPPNRQGSSLEYHLTSLVSVSKNPRQLREGALRMLRGRPTRPRHRRGANSPSWIHLPQIRNSARPRPPHSPFPSHTPIGFNVELCL